MDLTLIKNCRFYQNQELLKDHEVLCNRDRILEVGKQIKVQAETKVIDAEGKLLVPGFVDLQVNGGNKVFFNNEVSVEGLEKIMEAHEQKGTRYLLPTLISSDMEKITRSLEVVKEAMLQNPGILGLHLEGPFLNKEKYGGHNQDLIHPPTGEELDFIIDKGSGIIKIITIAPEVFSSSQLERLTGSGFVVSAGHSSATFEEAVDFFKQGVRCVTHLYNAMSPFQHRAPGLTGATLCTGVYAGIIVDGVHSHFSSVAMACRLKKDKLFLISDASFTGMEQTEEIMSEGRRIRMQNGQFYTDEGSLAGSSISMLDAVRNCIREVGIPAGEAIHMATTLPARVLGMEDSIGSIKPGASARLNLVDDSFEHIKTLH